MRGVLLALLFSVAAHATTPAAPEWKVVTAQSGLDLQGISYQPDAWVFVLLWQAEGLRWGGSDRKAAAQIKVSGGQSSLALADADLSAAKGQSELSATLDSGYAGFWRRVGKGSALTLRVEAPGAAAASVQLPSLKVLSAQTGVPEAKEALKRSLLRDGVRRPLRYRSQSIDMDQRWGREKAPPMPSRENEVSFGAETRFVPGQLLPREPSVGKLVRPLVDAKALAKAEAEWQKTWMRPGALQVLGRSGDALTVMTLEGARTLTGPDGKKVSDQPKWNIFLVPEQPGIPKVQSFIAAGMDYAERYSYHLQLHRILRWKDFGDFDLPLETAVTHVATYRPWSEQGLDKPTSYEVVEDLVEVKP